MALAKYLRAAAIPICLTLTGCLSDTILTKEGMAHVAREAITPITHSLDEQTDKLIEELRLEELTYELKELVKTTNESVKTGEKTVEQLTSSLKSISLLTNDIRVLVNNLEDTRVETTEMIKMARGLLDSVNQLMPEVTRLIANINELVEETKTEIKSGTTESTWMKYLPYIIYGIGGLIILLILLTLKRKKKNNVSKS